MQRKPSEVASNVDIRKEIKNFIWVVYIYKYIFQRYSRNATSKLSSIGHGSHLDPFGAFRFTHEPELQVLGV